MVGARFKPIPLWRGGGRGGGTNVMFCETG